MFVLDELIWKVLDLYTIKIELKTFGKNIRKDHPSVLEEGHMFVEKFAQGNTAYGWQTTTSGLVDAM